MIVSRKSTLVFGVAALLASSPAFAQEKKDEKADASTSKEKEAKKEDTPKNWGVSARISNRIGQGTFASVEGSTTTEDGAEIRTVGSDDVDNAFDRVSLGYGLGASYRFGLPADHSISTRLSLGWSHWLTDGGGINGPNEVRFQDIGLSGSWSGVKIPGIDAQLSSGLSMTFPTAKTSQISTKVLGTSLSVTLSKTFFRKLGLSLSFSGGKTFHRAEFPVIDQDIVGSENVIFREGENRKLGSESLVQIEGINGEYSFTGSLSAGFPIVEKLRGSASYGLGTYWSYSVDNDDEFAPTIIDSAGNEVVSFGRRSSQVTFASFGLSYPVLSDWNGIGVSASASASTSQSPKTADNKSFNFPFWNVNGAAANRSALSFSLSASY